MHTSSKGRKPILIRWSEGERRRHGDGDGVREAEAGGEVAVPLTQHV